MKKEATTIVKNIKKERAKFIAIVEPVEIKGETISEAAIPPTLLENIRIEDVVIIGKENEGFVIKKILPELRTGKEKVLLDLREGEDIEEEEIEPLALEEIEKESSDYYEAQKREIEEESKTKKVFKIIGVAVLVLLVVASWFFGFFGIVFYILGFYAALYFLSLLFKTTAIIDTIIAIGGIILYLGFLVFGLFLLYLVLRYMFEENFFIGLLLLIFGIPLAEMLFYAFIMALGAPLIYFRSLLEEKFREKDRYF